MNIGAMQVRLRLPENGSLKGKRKVVIPDFDRLMEETGDDTDGGPLA